MITLHVETKISDYQAWKAAFDRYDRARREHNVLAYRISRPANDEHLTYVDLDFADRTDAATFLEVLEKVWLTPLSQSVSSGHTMEIREVTEEVRLVERA